MDGSKISIIIPTFNCDAFIGETLRSVSAQTYVNWECIIVDDGSTDSTVEIIQQYIAEDNRFRFSRRSDLTKKKGGNICRNIGIKQSTGNFLMFLDGDDVLKSFCLEARLNHFNDNPDYDFLVFQMVKFDDGGEISGSELTRNSTNYLYDYLSYKIPWQTTCAIIKAEFIHSFLKEFDEDFPRLQDPEFYTRALLVGGVRFKVFYDLPADSMYRTFEGKSFNHVNSLRSFSLYIKKFYPLVSDRGDNGAVESLRILYIYVFNKYLRYLWGRGGIKIARALLYFLTTAKKVDLISSSSFLRSYWKTIYVVSKNTLVSGLNRVKKIQI